jgi:Ca-dependent carbohydrate-binding module xylan-binding
LALQSSHARAATRLFAVVLGFLLLLPVGGASAPGASTRADAAAPHKKKKKRKRKVHPVSYFQAERMKRSKKSIRIAHDPTAANHRALLFTRRASVRLRRTIVRAGAVVIRARGDQCQGPPVMTVSVDGHRVGKVAVSATGWTDYRVPARVSRRRHKMAIAFTNDHLVRGVCDRNLWVDAVGFTNDQPAAPAPQVVTGFTVGLVTGPAAAWETNMASAAGLHPKVVRVPCQIGASVSSVQNQVAGLAAKGVQALLLAEFPGRIPSQSEAQSLAAWAKAFGPGGTFWQGRSDGALAVRDIEFGNETNQSYQFGGVSSGSSYIARAQSYAQRARDAADAIRAANPNVGLLAQADNGGSGTSQWVDGMFSAVPDLNKHVAGWTAHPYGPKSRYGPIMDKAMSDTARHGDTTLPFFITEYGISTNNGVCLDSNYTWPVCLTYQQAAQSLTGAVNDLRVTYPRLRALFIFEQRDMANDSNGREANFGAVKSDGTPKGAFFTAVQSLVNTYRGP